MSLEEFFARAVTNLKARALRIILFLETAPPELKKLVEFLSEELSTVEIFLVEARRYQANGFDVVVPTLWGFTEQVRVERRLAADVLSAARRRWTESDFFAALTEGIRDPIAREAVDRLYRGLQVAGYKLAGGSGRIPSFTVRLPDVSHLALLSVTAEGTLTPSYASFALESQGSSLGMFRDRLASVLEEVTRTMRPPNYPKCWPKFESHEWAARVDELILRLGDLAKLESDQTVSN